MKKFNIRKVLDGLTNVSSSSSASPQPGNRENDTIQENLQSEHFQLCKTVRHGFPYQPSAMAFDPVQKILAIGTQSGALRLIEPLSEALSDLYKEFNALKERLGELTSKFEGVEAFVDDVRAGRSPSPPRPEMPPLPGEEEPPPQLMPAVESGRQGSRRNRVVVRRVKKPKTSDNSRA